MWFTAQQHVLVNYPSQENIDKYEWTFEPMKDGPRKSGPKLTNRLSSNQRN